MDCQGQGRLKALGETKLEVQPSPWTGIDLLKHAARAQSHCWARPGKTLIPKTGAEQRGKAWGLLCISRSQGFFKDVLGSNASIIFQSRIYQKYHKCNCKCNQAVTGRNQCIMTTVNISL